MQKSILSRLHGQCCGRNRFFLQVRILPRPGFIHDTWQKKKISRETLNFFHIFDRFCQWRSLQVLDGAPGFVKCERSGCTMCEYVTPALAVKSTVTGMRSLQVLDGAPDFVKCEKSGCTMCEYVTPALAVKSTVTGMSTIEQFTGFGWSAKLCQV